MVLVLANGTITLISFSEIKAEAIPHLIIPLVPLFRLFI